jgi:hypothetical protein
MFRSQLLRSIPWRIAALVLAVLVWFGLASSSRADLHVAEPRANAGTHYTGPALMHRFAFVNEGPDVVTIAGARASCGCLAPRLAQRILNAGESGFLELEVNTLSQAAGVHVWTVSLTYQSGNKTYEIPLQLTSRLLTEVQVQPAALILPAERAADAEIVLTDHRPKPLSITEVGASSAWLKPRVTEQGHDAEGHWVCKMHLAVIEDCPQGRHEETVHIYTNDAAYRELKVSVTIVKRPQQRVSAVPGQVSLTAAVGQPFPSRLVVIRDSENQQVHIERVVADDPAISCQWAQGPQNMATLKVRVERAKLHGAHLQSAVHVEISQPVPQTLTIPVTCGGP